VLITCADIAELYNCKDYLMIRFEKSSLALYRANLISIQASMAGIRRLNATMALKTEDYNG